MHYLRIKNPNASWGRGGGQASNINLLIGPDVVIESGEACATGACAGGWLPFIHEVPTMVRAVGCHISTVEKRSTTLALIVKHLQRQGQVVFIYVIPAPGEVPYTCR